MPRSRDRRARTPENGNVLTAAVADDEVAIADRRVHSRDRPSRRRSSLMQRQSLVSWLATTTLAVTTIAGTVGCVSEEADGLGDIGLNLVATSPSGNTYVLRNAEITVAGPG